MDCSEKAKIVSCTYSGIAISVSHVLVTTTLKQVGDSEQFEQVVFRVLPIRIALHSQKAIQRIRNRVTKPVIISGLLIITTICGLWYYKK